jgi:hypothetical protein
MSEAVNACCRWRWLCLIISHTPGTLSVGCISEGGGGRAGAGTRGVGAPARRNDVGVALRREETG